MNVRTYKQLVVKFTEYVNGLIGFQESTVFFVDPSTDDLFTLANLTSSDDELEGKQPKGDDLTQVKELYFTDDQIVIFPSTIGITGEVHQKVGIKFQNNFGQVVGDKDDEE